ncbi:hypothetical protein BKA62DRAFT_623214, partial [Auriculariales sp. MPI-PUGE-AT-0066]
PSVLSARHIPALQEDISNMNLPPELLSKYTTIEHTLSRPELVTPRPNLGTLMQSAVSGHSGQAVKRGTKQGTLKVRFAPYSLLIAVHQPMSHDAFSCWSLYPYALVCLITLSHMVRLLLLSSLLLC